MCISHEICIGLGCHEQDIPFAWVIDVYPTTTYTQPFYFDEEVVSDVKDMHVQSGYDHKHGGGCSSCTESKGKLHPYAINHAALVNAVLGLIARRLQRLGRDQT